MNTKWRISFKCGRHIVAHCGFKTDIKCYDEITGEYVPYICPETEENILDSGLCIFHNENYLKDSENKEAHGQNIKEKLKPKIEELESLICIGYYLPDFTSGYKHLDKFLDHLLITPIRANFSGAHFTGQADFSKAEFKEANLTNAVLFDADLTNAILSADLTNAYLANADLTDGYFFNANLTNAYLANADLTDGYFFNANLTDADLRLTDLRESLFDCESLKTTSFANFTVNTSQIHVVDSNLKEVSSCP